jgi:hypothetical protein
MIEGDAATAAARFAEAADLARDPRVATFDLLFARAVAARVPTDDLDRLAAACSLGDAPYGAFLLRGREDPPGAPPPLSENDRCAG